MPLIADNIIVFLFQVFMREFFRFRSWNWTKTHATIRSSRPAEGTMYPYAEICFAYKVNFERYSGKYKRGFWYRESSQDFARKFVPSEPLTVRVHPTKPENSYVFEEDQPWREDWKRPTNK